MLPLLVVTTMLKIDMMLYIISMIKLPYYTMQINLATFIIQYHTGHCFFLQINQQLDTIFFYKIVVNLHSLLSNRFYSLFYS
jgi:hypothetical protein